jgi:hypothetical protein
MVPLSTVYVRNALSNAEIQLRILDLSHSDRQMLLALDGRTSLGGLVRRLSALSAKRIYRSADKLLALGLIEPVRDRAAANDPLDSAVLASYLRVDRRLEFPDGAIGVDVGLAQDTDSSAGDLRLFLPTQSFDATGLLPVESLVVHAPARLELDSAPVTYINSLDEYRRHRQALESGNPDPAPVARAAEPLWRRWWGRIRALLSLPNA